MNPVASSSVDAILDPLNPPQREAATTLRGPVLILAGAGSGKTRALTHRIANLLRQGVAPWQILAVTFTNKAAEEMRHRLRTLLRITETAERPWDSHERELPVMGTFHSICMRILRREIRHLERDPSFVIYDEDDQEKLMKHVLKELRIDESVLKARPALGYVGRFKAEALSPKDAAKQATSEHMQAVTRAYAHYQQQLLTNNALDFDDLINETVRLFATKSDVLDRYQERWKFLNVDEYQDTNHAQYLFVTLLGQKYRNLCVIGDPDQAIYGFRGADIRNILEFEREYPDALRIKLEQNYRSVQPILTAADAVIAANPNRPEKHMWTDRADGAKVLVHQVRDERAEAEEALRRVTERQREGLPLNDQVILYRTNAQSRMFEEACMRMGIPYRIVGGVKFYARREVKDVIAYLHVLTNPFDSIALQRIVNVPSRKIGATTIGRLQEYASARRLTLWDAMRDAGQIEEIDSGTRGRIASFVGMIETLRTRSETEVVSRLTGHLLSEIGMERYLRDGTDEGEDRWQNVEELLSVMRKYDALAPLISLTSFLEEASLVSAVDSLAEARTDALTLMTVHLCKGLEFEHVIIAGCEEGIFPHSSSLFDREQLEEERRLMYVGMTRAKTNLSLLHAESRLLWGERRSNAGSRFLDDLPEDVTERRTDSILSAFAWSHGRSGSPVEPFRQNPDIDVAFNDGPHAEDDLQAGCQEGVRVSHPTFGTGTVIERRGDVVDVRFDAGAKKTFALSIAPLTVIS